MILCKDRADFVVSVPALWCYYAVQTSKGRENRAMRLVIEIAAAALLMVCISASSAALAAGKAGRSADGLSCSFSVAKNASPAARCAAIKRQCGGKFYANNCGDKLMSAM
jgi:hypothetical protein